MNEQKPESTVRISILPWTDGVTIASHSLPSHHPPPTVLASVCPVLILLFGSRWLSLSQVTTPARVFVIAPSAFYYSPLRVQ